MSTLENRNSMIDFLKGMATVLVVIGHVIQIVFSPQNFDDNLLFNIIYSFHMPLFIFLSGYCEGISKKSKNMRFLIRRIRNLFVPFVIWTLILSAYNYALFKTNILLYLISVFKSPDNSFWFIWVLFILDVCLYLYNRIYDKIFYIMSNFLHSKFILILNVGISIFIPGFLLFLISKFHILGFGLVIGHFIYFFSGYFISYYNLDKIKVPKVLFFLVLISFSYLINFWRRIPDDSLLFTNIFVYSTKLYKLFKIFMAYGGIIIIIKLANLLYDFKVSTILTELGKYSKQIYLMQIFFMKRYFGNIMLDTFISLILGILFPYAISKVIDRNRKLNLFLFGITAK